MKQRLLFDRIDLRRDHAVPGKPNELSATIDSDSADPSALECNLAAIWTERASDEVIRHAFVIERGLDVAGRGRHTNDSRVLCGNEARPVPFRTHE